MYKHHHAVRGAVLLCIGMWRNKVRAKQHRNVLGGSRGRRVSLRVGHLAPCPAGKHLLPHFQATCDVVCCCCYQYAVRSGHGLGNAMCLRKNLRPNCSCCAK